MLQNGGIIYEQTSQNNTNTSHLHSSIFTMSACADSKMADAQQKNTADKSDTQQGIDIAAYKKKLADNRENYKLSCEQYSTDTDTVKTLITGIYRLQTVLLKICRKRMSCMSWRVEYTALLHRRAGIQ